MKREEIERVIKEARKGNGRPNLRTCIFSEADLSELDLSGFDLEGADLSRANLSRANLDGVDLQYANLRCADLKFAKLRGADLQSCNVKMANFSGADLSRANLRGLDMRTANIEGAKFIGADLRGTNGEFVIFHFPDCHKAIAAGGMISIGCEFHSFEEWRVRGRMIGKRYGYTQKEINLYMYMIRKSISILETKKESV